MTSFVTLQESGELSLPTKKQAMLLWDESVSRLARAQSQYQKQASTALSGLEQASIYIVRRWRKIQHSLIRRI